MEDVPMHDDHFANTTATTATFTNSTTTSTHRSHMIRRQVSQISEPVVKTGLLGTSSNLVNTIVGAGIIGIPYAIDQSGLVVGVLLLILVGLATDKSLRMIVQLATFHPRIANLGVLTYEDLLRIPFGNTGSHFILFSMFVLSYGAMVAYLIIIKDSIPTVLGLGDSFVQRELIMLCTSLVIIVPLSMLRDISQLATSSFLSITADAVLVVIVLSYSPVQDSVQDHGGFGQVVKDYWMNTRVFIGLGVLSTAMACQHTAFLISGTLEDCTMPRWGTVTGRSLLLATLLSMLLGLFGYLGYLENTEGDILNNFEGGSMAVNAARILLAITMFFTYPMELFVARHVLVQLFYNGNMDNTTVDTNGEQVPEQKLVGLLGRRETITLGLYGLTLIPALIVDDLGPVLSITGSLGASCVAYIAPGLAYIGINGADFLQWSSGSSLSHDYSSETTPGQIELPVVGDSSATINVPNSTQSSGKKPWWYYLTLMPIWCAVARQGDRGTTEFLRELGVAQGHPVVSNDRVTIGPYRSDYIVSILFIFWGLVAAVCGVLSNIYVQIHEIFLSP